MFGIKLKTQPNSISLADEELLLLAKRVVARYVSNKSIPKREQDDVVMAIVEKFLIKKKQILERFKGESKLSTYCISVLNRMCCEVIRSQMKDWNVAENQEYHDVAESFSQTDLLLLKEETKLFERILLLFGSERYKLKLFFAFYFKLRIIELHISKYSPGSTHQELLDLFLVENLYSKGEIYEKLSEVIALVEGKVVKPDALRMWMNKCRTIMIDKLNSNSMNGGYDNDSFQALFEYSYQIESVENEISVNK